VETREERRKRRAREAKQYHKTQSSIIFKEGPKARWKDHGHHFFRKRE
jgi:hypothetical protein